MTKRAEELIDDALDRLDKLLSCKNPCGNSHDKENDFFNSIEMVKVALWNEDSREYLYFAVTVMHRIADKLGDRSHYSWIAELELKTKAVLVS